MDGSAVQHDYLHGAIQRLLWFLFRPRINLSPFTKDFRGEEQYNESIDVFCSSAYLQNNIQIKMVKFAPQLSKRYMPYSVRGVKRVSHNVCGVVSSENYPL